MKLSSIAGVAALVLSGCASPQRPDGGLITEGSQAPDVVGVDQQGVEHRLKDLRGHPCVVYFYPKDQTPGCTREACAFRDVWRRYQEAEVAVLGVSSDTRESHRRFAEKHALEFPLIADADGTWARAFGVKATMGLYQRVSFLIAPDGKIAKVYDAVDPGVHAVEVLEDAARL